MGRKQTTEDRVSGEIRAELARQRRSVRDLVGVLNLSKNAVYRRNEGLIAYRVSEIYKIADWLGVPVSQFLHNSEHSLAEEKRP